MTDTHNSLPLRGLRALDLCAGLGDGCGRYLEALKRDFPSAWDAQRKHFGFR